MRNHLINRFRSEVDLNGSLWYSFFVGDDFYWLVLKLTSTGHYGIIVAVVVIVELRSEVDLNGSLWYIISPLNGTKTPF